ncbi:hypothetical protein [Mycobacterium saskatchewanense]|nr:hypothetical protein [Mycobacterium saskatchewanense]
MKAGPGRLTVLDDVVEQQRRLGQSAPKRTVDRAELGEPHTGLA